LTTALGHAPRGESRQPVIVCKVRLDYQLQGRHAIQINFIVFDLASRSSEVPLLPHDLFGLPAVRRRPSNGEFLQAVAPVLIKRFPQASEEQLKEAHAYAYGGCIIQELGYYPFGSHFFSDLVHYVRSADFLQALLDESGNLKEYAFALGAVAHYGADVDGHSIAVNRAVPLLYPKLRKQFGNEVT
jgi:hypothetical protein